jgi:hypothetical protein
MLRKISFKQYIIIIATIAIFCSGLYCRRQKYYNEYGWNFGHYLPAIKLYRIDLTTGQYYIATELQWGDDRVDFYGLFGQRKNK